MCSRTECLTDATAKIGARAEADSACLRNSRAESRTTSAAPPTSPGSLNGNALAERLGTVPTLQLVNDFTAAALVS